MGGLNRFFGSTESIVKDTEREDESIIDIWRKYHQTVPRKKTLIEGLSLDNEFQSNLTELKRILVYEFVDIGNEEKEEAELISDLEAIEHDQRIKRVHRIEQCLRYVGSKYEYVDELLHHLHSILIFQIHITDKLLAGSKDSEKLIAHPLTRSPAFLDHRFQKTGSVLNHFHRQFRLLWRWLLYWR